MQKNVASQKVAVFAWDTDAETEKTGDAANITAQISKDGGVTNATNDTNPTELDAADAPGVYIFDLLKAETDANLIVIFAKSGTADIKLEPVFVYTIQDQAIKAKTDIIGASVALETGGNLADVLDDTGTTIPAQISGLNDVSAADIDTQLSGTHDAGSWEAADVSGLATQSVLDEVLDLLENQLVINKATSELWLYNDAGDAVIKKWPLTDRNGAVIVLEGTGPANRGKRTT